MGDKSDVINKNQVECIIKNRDYDVKGDSNISYNIIIFVDFYSKMLYWYQ